MGKYSKQVIFILSCDVGPMKTAIEHTLSDETLSDKIIRHLAKLSSVLSDKVLYDKAIGFFISYQIIPHNSIIDSICQKFPLQKNISTLRFTIITKLGRMVVESNISQYAKVVVMSIT